MKVGIAIAGAALLAFSGCASSDSASGHRSAGVPLVAAPAEMHSQCSAAAARVGFAVPCPTVVPSLDHRGMTCDPTTQDPASFPPCTGTSGFVTPAFFVDFQGFRVGPDYVGVDGKPIGHLTLRAEPHREGPPCFGTVVGMIALPQHTATEYRCTNNTLRVQRDAEHGEGAYVGHVLLAWTQDGIDYSVSAHGHTAVNLALVERIAGSVELVA